MEILYQRNVRRKIFEANCRRFTHLHSNKFPLETQITKVIEDKCNNDVLNGIVEADETLVLLSHKGKHIDGVKPRKRGGKANFRGISHEQQGVLVAVDRKQNIVSKVYGNGKFPVKM